MTTFKVLEDLINSAAGAKAHYDVWWAQMSDALPECANVMNKHSDFFRASQDAHYMACFVYIAHLFDKRKDSSSLPSYLTLIKDSTEPMEFQSFEARFSELAELAAPLITARHKTVAHVDALLTEKDVFLQLKITWNEVRKIVHDTAAFVEMLAKSSNQDTTGIPRDGRLSEATLKLLRSLK